MTRQRLPTRGQDGRPATAAPQAYAEALRHHRDGRLEEAVACYRRTLAAQPGFAEAQYNLGVALARLERRDEAIACLRCAIALQPGLAEAHFDLGCALAALGQLDEAAGCFRRAVNIRPAYLAAHNNLGNALKALGRVEEAAACYRAAIALAPDQPALHANLGNTLKALERYADAAAAYRRALALKPDYVEVYNSLSVMLLSQGDMASGWAAFEWRWQAPQMIGSRRNFTQPQWRGEAVPAGPEGHATLLIHAEQGFGDTIQFCRYAPLAAARGLRVILEVQPPLVHLLRGLDGVEQVLARGETLPAYVLHCPMLSLPFALGTTLDSIPAAPAYLHADPDRVAALAGRLAATGQTGRRVGLVWAGNPGSDLPPREAAHARRRSLDPTLLTPLLDIQGVHFCSLQKIGPAAPDAFALTDLMNEMSDFADTAALIQNLDLVITVDTAVAHLAGALGRPDWVMTRRDHCWRWLDGRTDSPWYPSLRIYRQTRQDDWTDIVAAVAADLRDFAAG